MKIRQIKQLFYKFYYFSILGYGKRSEVRHNVFYTRADRPHVPRSLLYKGYRDTILGVKWQGRGVDHPPLPSAEVKYG